MTSYHETFHMKRQLGEMGQKNLHLSQKANTPNM
jgi:hypothetical protein